MINSTVIPKGMSSSRKRQVRVLWVFFKITYVTMKGPNKYIQFLKLLLF